MRVEPDLLPVGAAQEEGVPRCAKGPKRRGSWILEALGHTRAPHTATSGLGVAQGREERTALWGWRAGRDCPVCLQAGPSSGFLEGSHCEVPLV
jgi:hypothetical protein